MNKEIVSPLLFCIEFAISKWLEIVYSTNSEYFMYMCVQIF